MYPRAWAIYRTPAAPMRVAEKWPVLVRAAVLIAGLGVAWTACIEPELRASHPKSVRFIAFNALYIASFMLLMFTATRRHVAKDPR